MVRSVALAAAVTLTTLAPLAAQAADAPRHPVDHAALMTHAERTPRAARAKATTPPASGTATAPLDTRAGRPIVDVMINGKGPYRFFVDTGASHTVIDSSLTAELGLPVLGETHMGDPSNPFAIRADRVRIDELAVGDARFQGVE